MENGGIFNEQLEYFWAIWYILLPFGTVCWTLVYFSRFGIFERRKIWQLCSEPIRSDFHGLVSTAAVNLSLESTQENLSQNVASVCCHVQGSML
jgi:hypothetical protein